MSKINCFNNIRLQTNAPEWKINKAKAIIIATYCIPGRCRLLIIYKLNNWKLFWRLDPTIKVYFFLNQHTHTHTPTKSKTKPKNPIKTGTYILKLSVCMALGSSTLAKRFDSAFYIVEKRIVYITVKCEIWLLQLTLMLSHRSNIITI